MSMEFIGFGHGSRQMCLRIISGKHNTPIGHKHRQFLGTNANPPLADL